MNKLYNQFAKVHNIRVLIEMALNLQIKLGRTDILTILSLSISVEYLFIYFVFLWFHSSKFCSFPHIDFADTLLDLYVSI